MDKRQERHQRELEQRRRDILDSIAQTGEKTARQIADDLCISPSTAIKHVAQMRKDRLKFIFIVRWLRGESGGGFAPVYAIGNRPDVPKPKMGGKVIDSETQMERERQRKLKQIKPPLAINDPMLAWLMPNRENREAA